MKINNDNINNIVDSNGMKIDDGIKKIVIKLNQFGIKTIASCEGHVGWGLPYPWIDIEFSSLDNLVKLSNIKNVNGLFTIMFMKRDRKSNIEAIRIKNNRSG